MAIDKLELEKSMNSTSVALQELQDATIACLARNKVLYEQYWEHLLRQTKGARYCIRIETLTSMLLFLILCCLLPYIGF